MGGGGGGAWRGRRSPLMHVLKGVEISIICAASCRKVIHPLHASTEVNYTLLTLIDYQTATLQLSQIDYCRLTPSRIHLKLHPFPNVDISRGAKGVQLDTA
jgi:hypothetical protein